jgi:hypothetical protein
MSNFLEEALKDKRAELRDLVVKVLNVYLTTPLSERHDTTENRRVRLRKLIDEAVDAEEKSRR